MGYSVLHGEDVDVAFLDKLDYVDQACYEPKYWGEQDNTVARYEKNPRSFVFVMDDERDLLAGYINFFPCERGLYEDNLFRSEVIRDDDITPDEVAPYRTDENHLFIISLAIHPDYQGTEVIKILSNDFIDYLNALQSEGYPITDIMGTAVSQHGRKALHNYLFRSVRELADGNTVFSCDGNRLQNLLDRKLYFKTYRDDIYVMFPLVEHEANLRMERFIADVKAAGSGCESAAVDGVVASADSSGDPASDEEITRTLIDSVREYVAYECSNEVVRDMEFVSLGCFDFLHTTDEYPGPVFNDKRYPMGAAQAAERGKFRWATKAQQPSPCDTQAEPVDASSAAIDEACPYEVVMGEVRGYAVLAAHLKTHMFVLSVFLPDYPYSSTQMEDQVSFGYLKIRNPKNPGEYIPFYEYLLQTYGLHACGQAKCVLYMSNKPKDERELQDILAAEAYDNYETDYSISSDELKELCETNRAQFDDYEAYLSNRAIAYIHEEYSDSVLERVEDFADYLFIVIMTLFQNTALAKVNMKVTHLLETDGDVTPRAKLDIDREYGRTIRFWEMQNFKYLSSQMESAVIKEAFLNQELKDSYAEHQEYLEHVVEVKAAIADNRNGMIINVVAIILAVIQIEPFVTGVLQSVYGFLGIEADYAASTFNYTVFGGVVLFLLVLIILRRRSSYVQRRRM